SSVTTAPARPCCATSVAVTAAGTGAGATGALVGAVADCEPPFPVAVTTSESVKPMSPGVSTYDDPVAPLTALQPLPAASQRCHWYVNATGLPPFHVPGTAASGVPALAVPAIVGGVSVDGAPVG